ncbi:Ham1-like protein [Cylindrobasidium torrendii FP15055 ss-10]|uniref:Inosine triphosphate pyrophosphatase n=1 Tax=Cylindrobasidium torrendii FP15055 ss-10 TaxID=1314674 RepID=A0A0D7BRX3_9AGAR|nr:Ham1-like protein [Cylindrobasidium torrendii FP15055 ss-10]
MPDKSIVFVTGNANKLREVKAILSIGDVPIDVVNQEVDIPEIQGSTQEVARAKCAAAAQAVGGPCITEDTALCFKALNGLPGPYIKYFMQDVGHAGLNRMLDGFTKPGSLEGREAWALCTFAYSPGPGQEVLIFEGKTDGHVVPARGPTTFGWDATFQPDGFTETYAEMDPKVKNTISHRYRALEKLRVHLQALRKE